MLYRLVAACVVVGLVAACSGDSSSESASTPELTTSLPSQPVTTLPASTTTALPVTTTTSIPAVEVADLTSWTRIADEEGIFGSDAWVEAAVGVADGFVAVGPSGAWRSDDGVNWEAGTIELPMGSWIADVATGPHGLIAVGATEQDGRRKGAVWISQDGRSWEQVAHDEVAFGSDTAGIEGVVYWDSMLVAVGNSCVGEPGSCPSAPTAWISYDGISWQRTAVIEGFGGMNDVTVAHDRLVAVGSLWDEDNMDAAMWVSFDGLEWGQIGQTIHDELVFGDDFNNEGGQWLSQIATQGEVMVAVGASYDSETKKARPRILSSEACTLLDAATKLEEGSYCWTVFSPDGIDYVEAVTALESGFIVAGYQSTDPNLGSIWASDEDRLGYLSWHLVSADSPMTDATLTDIATTGQTVIVTGLSYTDTPIWVAS